MVFAVCRSGFEAECNRRVRRYRRNSCATASRLSVSLSTEAESECSLLRALRALRARLLSLAPPDPQLLSLQALALFYRFTHCFYSPLFRLFWDCFDAAIFGASAAKRLRNPSETSEQETKLLRMNCTSERFDIDKQVI